MSILYDTRQHTHRSDVYGVPLHGVTVLFGELESSSYHSRIIEMFVPRILCSCPPTRFKYIGGERNYGREGFSLS